MGVGGARALNFDSMRVDIVLRAGVALWLRPLRRTCLPVALPRVEVVLLFTLAVHCFLGGPYGILSSRRPPAPKKPNKKMENLNMLYKK